MSAAEQGCTLCDDLTTLVDGGEVEITELYKTLEVWNPAALLQHAKKHSHPDLGSLTYHGSRIVAVADVDDKGVPVTDPHNALHVVKEIPAGTLAVAPAPEPEPEPQPVPEPDPEQDAGFVAVDPTTRARVQGLADTHQSGRVRDLAAQLLTAIEEHEGWHLDRIRLEQLVAQRDQLSDEIAALEARLTTPAHIPHAPKVDLGDVRLWAHEHGYAVSDRGPVSPKIVADYLRAHGGEVS